MSPPCPPKPCPPKKRLRYPSVEDISEDEDLNLPKKRSRAPEVVVCEPDVVYLGSSSPAEDPDIIYMGSFKSTRKTSPRAPPNSPTYPPPSVPQSSNIWVEGTSVYPVQVIFFFIILTLYYIKIFSGGADCSRDVHPDAAPHQPLYFPNQENFD